MASDLQGNSFRVENFVCKNGLISMKPDAPKNATEQDMSVINPMQEQFPSLVFHLVKYDWDSPSVYEFFFTFIFLC
jgi:hypothetical protein